jgi:hypothetical protein
MLIDLGYKRSILVRELLFGRTIRPTIEDKSEEKMRGSLQAGGERVPGLRINMENKLHQTRVVRLPIWSEAHIYKYPAALINQAIFRLYLAKGKSKYKVIFSYSCSILLIFIPLIIYLKS